MATTKKSAAGRPKISSSHARGPAASKGATKTKRPASKAGATKKSAATKPVKAKRPATPKPSRAAARSNAIATSTQRPRKAPAAAQVEVKTEAAQASRELALAVAKAALDKKAVNVQIVDVVGRVDYTDFLVVMSGRSDRHVLSVADAIEEELRKLKRKPEAVEGRPQGNWVVLDFGEVVAHVFQEEARSFYDLDNLWQDARKIPVSDQRPAASS
jgi:ribosome-associated protein